MGTSGRAITSMPPGYHSTCVYDTYVPLVYFQYLRSLLGVTAQPLCITTIVSGLQGGSQRAECVRVGERGCYDNCAIDVVLHRLDSGKRAVAASSPRRSARPTISFNVKAFSIVGRGEGVLTLSPPFPPTLISSSERYMLDVSLSLASARRPHECPVIRSCRRTSRSPFPTLQHMVRSRF